MLQSDLEKLALNRLSRMLRDTGRVEVAGAGWDPEEALEQLGENSIDALFLDIEMPGARRVFVETLNARGGCIALSARSVKITADIRTSAHQCGLALFDEFACRDQRKHLDPLALAQQLKRNHTSVREFDGVAVTVRFGTGLDEFSTFLGTKTQIPLHERRDVFQNQAGAGWHANRAHVGQRAGPRPGEEVEVVRCGSPESAT
jgi:CheY-like chemotaxis protein